MPAQQPIRVMVVDDHPVVRRGIICCLKTDPAIQVVGEADNGVAALDLARKLRPDVVLMDLEMPRMTGIAAAEILRSTLPEAAVLILTMHRQGDYVARTLQMGARGYLLKDAPPEDLLAAIKAVHAGQTSFSPELTRVALSGFVNGQTRRLKPPLTPREREVLVQIADGLGNKEIAANLNVGVRTVETHRERIMRKLNIHTIAGLTRYAISSHLVPLQGAALDSTQAPGPAGEVQPSAEMPAAV